MKKYLLLFALFFNFFAAYSQEPIDVWSIVFEENAEKYYFVPMASVWFYDYENPEKLEYFVFGNGSNWWHIGKIPDKKYRAKIMAPGYKTREVVVGNLSSKPLGKERAATVHFKLEKSTTNTLRPTTYSIKNFEKAKKMNLWEVIASLKGLNIDKKTMEITTDNGKKVLWYLCGYTTEGEKKFSQFLKLPAETFGLLDMKFLFYDLSSQKSDVGGMLNLVVIGEFTKSFRSREIGEEPFEMYILKE
ncbi:MAG: hypothetical protein LBU22_14425 [Dysgonamonadaceae bacterium]|jgi:hypothetical protein|nr:hypothetical protein [Dysgonamonadaceae bacterium]